MRDSLRYDLTAKQLFAFTPKGDVVNLPAGSTPVDFAYAVHTEVGHRCIASAQQHQTPRCSASRACALALQGEEGQER